MHTHLQQVKQTHSREGERVSWCSVCGVQGCVMSQLRCADSLGCWPTVNPAVHIQQQQQQHCLAAAVNLQTKPRLLGASQLPQASMTGLLSALQ
jgi:hypothetical protein